LKRYIDSGGGIHLGHDYELRKHEMEEQLRSDHDWDDYQPENYGWEKPRVNLIRRRYNLEFAKEFGITSIPHKTRRFTKS